MFTVGIPTAVIILRLLFRNSILFRIGTLWAINLLIIVASTKLSTVFPEKYPTMISLPVGILISVFLIFLVHNRIRKPLQRSLDHVEVLASGNLNIQIDPDDLRLEDEVGILAKSLGKLSDNLAKAIGDILNISMLVNSASAQLKATSSDLSSGTSCEAVSIEEISSSVEPCFGNFPAGRRKT